MRGDGANPPQARDSRETSARPPSYGGQFRPEAPAPGSPYGDTLTQGDPRPASDSPQWQRSGLDEPPAQWPATVPASSGGSLRQRTLPTFLRPPAVWFTGIAAAGMVFILVMVLASPPVPTPRTAGAIATATFTPVPIPTAVPTATATPLPVFSLPAFSDWRAAYLAADGKLHVTSLDGQTDLVGPALSLNTADTTNSTETPGFADTYQTYTSMSVSPNGQYLAFIAQPPQPIGAGIAPPAGDLMIVSLTGNAAWSPRLIPGPVTNIGGWSPDSQTLAYIVPPLSGAVGVAAPGSPTLAYTVPRSSIAAGIYTVTLPNGSPLQVPAPASIGTVSTEGAVSSAHVLGWIDASHLALVVSTPSFAFPLLPGETTLTPSGTPSTGMLAPPVAQTGPAGGRSMLAAPWMRPNSGPDVVTLATVNIATGAAYTIAPLRQGGHVALSPDGTQVVAQNNCLGICADAPLVTEVINTATGATHALPTSDAAIEPTGGFVWNPQADAFAATVNATATAPAQVFLVDVQHDAAQSVRTNAFVVGWSPNGQTLAVADASSLGHGAAKVWLVSPGSGNAPVALPQPVVAFIGFVRTSAS